MSASSVVLLKLLMLLTMNFLAVKASIPPNKSESSDKIDKSTFQERHTTLLIAFNHIPLVMPGIILSATLISNFASSAPVCSGDVNDELRRLSFSFLASFVVVTTGASIRLLSFKTLGDLFTFEVTIRSNHRIVDTGPYAIVRHPSYTGSFMMWAGDAILVLSPQSPAITCGWAASSLAVKLVIVLWLSWTVFVWYTLSGRGRFEERNLRNHFAQTGLWNDYLGGFTIGMATTLYLEQLNKEPQKYTQADCETRTEMRKQNFSSGMPHMVRRKKQSLLEKK